MLRFKKSRLAWLVAAGSAVVLIGAGLLVADGTFPRISKYQRFGAQAIATQQAQIDYVRPGIALKIKGVTVGTDNSVKVRFTIADPKGVPLDRDGIVTPGVVTVRFVLGYVGAGTNRYYPYTKNATTGLAATDANGTFEKVAVGEYIYTMTTKLPANYEKTVTTSVGGQASRNLAEWSLPNSVDNDVYHWVPNGAPVTEMRDIVRTDTCNGCHDPLSAHGSRRKIEYCVLCHQPDLVQTATGLNFDFPVLIHKIHMGSSLPSVKAGTPYKIGNTDFSNIVLPAGAQNCSVCHTDKAGAKQHDKWLTNPTRNACGACHDNVNFATGANHVNLPQISDNQCKNCHVPKGELERDVSIIGAHLDTRLSSELIGLKVEPISVQNTAPGQKPVFTFQIRDKNGVSIHPSTLDRVTFVLAGPTTDYQIYFSEDARKAEGPAGGPYVWNFTNAIPADASGTFAIGTEVYKNTTILEGTAKQVVVRDTAKNVTHYFSVDSSKVLPRREIVTIEKCNSCHFKLETHGRNRNSIDHCVKCHNPAKTETGRPAAAGKQQSISLRTMIHGIHSGAERVGGYQIYSGSGTKYEYSGVEYPGDLRNCTACHVNNSEQVSSVPEYAAPVVDPKAPIAFVGPVTAACTACHNSPAAYSHAAVNTTAIGESCNTCHGPNAAFSVNKVHAR